MRNQIMASLALTSSLALIACGSPDISGEEGGSDSMAAQIPEVQSASLADLPTLDVGLKVGESAPLDAVFSTDKGETSFSDIVAQGPAVLVFTRSVEWCPFCQTQLKETNGMVAELKTRGYALYGVSYDSVESQSRFVENQKLDYGMLSDESSAAIDAFGLRDPQYTEGKATGVPYAAIVVVDSGGKIAAKSVSGDYRKRPTNEQVLAIVDSAG